MVSAKELGQSIKPKEETLQKAWLYYYQHEIDKLALGHMELFNSTIETAKLALRGAFIINGGACIAILSFLASIDRVLEPIFYTQVKESLIIFSFGLITAVICSLFFYIAQCCYQQELHIATHNDSDTPDFGTGDKFRIISIVLFLLSVFFFFKGIAQASYGVGVFEWLINYFA